MLVEFSVKNFRSIKDLQVVSFVATNINGTSETNSNIVSDAGERLLKSVGIYGANASGKSNVIKAMELFFQTVAFSSMDTSLLYRLCQPHRSTLDEGSFFQVVFTLKSKKYRYGLLVASTHNESMVTSASAEAVIVNEWLFEQNSECEDVVFIRQHNSILEACMPEMKVKVDAAGKTSLLAQLHASNVNPVTTDIFALFRNIAASTVSYKHFSMACFKNESMKSDMLELLDSFGIHYEDMKIIGEIENSSNRIPFEKIRFRKTIGGKCYWMNLGYDESEGTRRLFEFAGLLIMIEHVGDAFVFFVDEIDNNFHPSLLIQLVNFVNSSHNSRSQLVFTSHDTNLLSPKVLRRDQIYFTEKQMDESTKLYSLADLRGIKDDSNFAKQYLAGFYGAKPLLHTFE